MFPLAFFSLAVWQILEHLIYKVSSQPYYPLEMIVRIDLPFYDRYGLIRSPDNIKVSVGLLD